MFAEGFRDFWQSNDTLHVLGLVLKSAIAKVKIFMVSLLILVALRLLHLSLCSTESFQVETAYLPT